MKPCISGIELKKAFLALPVPVSGTIPGGRGAEAWVGPGEGGPMRRLLQAMKFAAEKHANQRRKNPDATPYINHPIEVAEILASVGGIEDEEVLAAAVLHDTVEDTSTTFGEIEGLFGSRIARIVKECTDDRSLEKAERKRLQIVHAPGKSPEAKCVKIADKTCNLASVLADPPKGWSVERQREYFGWAEKVIEGLLGVNGNLDARVKDVLARGKSVLGAEGPGGSPPCP